MDFLNLLPVIESVSIAGNSMFPVIYDTESVTICKMKEYHLGDILAFKYKGEFLIHRLLKIENGRYFAKGDNSFRIEDFLKDDILGKAIVANDLNNTPQFIECSLAIGYLFKKCGYKKHVLFQRKEYIEYKKRFIDSISAESIFLKVRGGIFYSNLPDLTIFPCAIVKGEPLSLLAYGDTGQRISQDVDILAPKYLISVLENSFEQKGFDKISLNRVDEIYVKSTSHQAVPLKKISPICGIFIFFCKRSNVR